MDVEFVGQPFEGRPSLGATLGEWLADADTFTACVAWTQSSGLDLLAGHVERVRRRGGETTAIIGIDGGIATRKGLADTLNAFATVYVVHDVGPRTFHPKLYLVGRDRERLVVVGSNNLTEGGLYSNYEASLVLRLRVGAKRDDAVLAQVDDYIAKLIADGTPARLLTIEMIDELASRTGVLDGEGNRLQQVRVQLAQTERGLRDLFGSSPRGLVRAPRTRRSRTPPGTPSAAPVRPRRAAVEATWSKELTASDAMRKTVGNQRAYVILGKAGHEIDQKTYFRQRFFDGVSWAKETMRTGAAKEVASIPFQVVIEDQILADYRVRVDHSPKRIANQNNAPTWMHWSSLIGVVRQTDLTGYTLTLERLEGGRFRLRLAA
jgi:HKD family nuclease